MGDFTLVIPTHNRPALFRALLTYLQESGADWPIIVMDSSRPDLRDLNIGSVKESQLVIDYVDYADKTAEEKWRLGIHRVTTPYCALCADDDVIITSSIDHCLSELRTNPSVAVAQGYSFSFMPQKDQLELNNIPYYTKSIVGASALDRLGTLFAHYQAPAYGYYRTRLLQNIFDALQAVNSILFRELLWSALTATAGHIIRVPCFSYGRSMGASGNYEYWHPLEWLCKNPAFLFEEYTRYRDVLAAAVIARPGHAQSAQETKRHLDYIHMRYLVKHAPDSAMRFIIEQQLSGARFEEYWPRHEIQVPLIDAAAIGLSASSAEGLAPVTWCSDTRGYVLLPQFYEPVGIEKLGVHDISLLIKELDRYSLRP